MTASSANQPDRGGAYGRSGLAIAVLLLAVQTLYFEGAALSRNPKFRPSLEKIAGQLNYQLPAYQNSAEFAVLQSSLSDLPDRSQLFSTMIRNQAAFAQPYPNLKLTMLDYAGNPFARRTFRPQDYLPKALPAMSAMPPDANTVISLNIAAPKTKAGGYTFELIY